MSDDIDPKALERHSRFWSYVAPPDENGTDANGQAALLAEAVLRAYRRDADAFIKLFGSNGPALGAQNVQSQERELERLERLIAKYEEHEKAHAEAVDECTHDEKTWVCCGACHCVAIQKRQEAEAKLRERDEEIERLKAQLEIRCAGAALESRAEAAEAHHAIQRARADRMEMDMHAAEAREKKLREALEKVRQEAEGMRPSPAFALHCIALIAREALKKEGSNG